jgi:hypothetical protein
MGNCISCRAINYCSKVTLVMGCAIAWPWGLDVSDNYCIWTSQVAFCLVVLVPIHRREEKVMRELGAMVSKDSNPGSPCQ